MLSLILFQTVFVTNYNYIYYIYNINTYIANLNVRSRVAISNLITVYTYQNISIYETIYNL